jgi:hypothetical protein
MNQTLQPQPRAAAHTALFFPVKYRLFRNNPIFENRFNVGRSMDLSMNNLLLAVSHHNAVNTNLDMELDFPEGKSAYVVGKVVAGVDEMIGGIVHHFDRIVFAKLDTDAEDLIVKSISDNNKKFH